MKPYLKIVLASLFLVGGTLFAQDEPVNFTRSVFPGPITEGFGGWSISGERGLHGELTVDWTGADWKSFASATSLKLKAALAEDGWIAEDDGAVVVNYGPFFISLLARRGSEEMHLILHVFPKGEHECYISFVQFERSKKNA